MKILFINLLFIWLLLLANSNQRIDLNSLAPEELVALKSNIENTIASQLSEKLDYLQIPGICIGMDYGVQQELCVGVSDIDAKTPMTTDMNYRISYVTQTFTAVAILKLVEAKQIELNNTIDLYFPELTIPNKESVTIYQLLHMTSGIPEYNDAEPDITTALTPTELIGLISEMPAEFAPGEGYKFSHTNYVLLGMIIELKTGKTYSEYIQSLISSYLPKTKIPTGMFLDSPTSKTYNSLYDVENDKWILDEVTFGIQPSLIFATSSMVSVVDEMAYWMRLIMERTILSDEMVKELLDFTIATDYGNGGAGMDEFFVNNYKLNGKFGSLLGHSAMIGYDTDNFIAFSFFFNVESPEQQIGQMFFITDIILQSLYSHLQIATYPNPGDYNETYNETGDYNYFSEPFSEREIIEFIIVISLIFMALAFIRV